MENVGDAPALGPVTVADALPAGLRATGIAGSAPKRGGALGETVALSCSLEHLSCEAPGPLAPYDAIEIRIERGSVAGREERGSEHGQRVRWRARRPFRSTRPVTIGQPGGFGVEGYELAAESEGGGPVTQAGAHPFQVTGSILLDQGPDGAPLHEPAECGSGCACAGRGGSFAAGVDREPERCAALFGLAVRAKASVVANRIGARTSRLWGSRRSRSIRVA